MADAVEIFDTTLRDGTQARGRVALGRRQAAHRRAARRARRRLHRGRLARLEPEGRRVLRARARAQRGSAPRSSAFGATRRAGIARRRRSASLRALRRGGHARRHASSASRGRCTSSEVLRTTPRREPGDDRGHRRATCARRASASSTTPSTSSTAARDDADYALATLHAAARGGAETIVLCDTNGGSLPWQIADGVARRARGRRRGRAPSASTPTTTPAAAWPTRSPPCAPARATCRARSTATASAAATPTCAPSSPTSSSSSACAACPRARSPSSTELSRFVAEVANLRRRRRTCRTSAAAPSRTRAACTSRPCAARRGAYEHVDPARVGNETRVVVSELVGRATLLPRPTSTARRSTPPTPPSVLERRSRSARRAASRSNRRRRRSRCCCGAPPPTTSRPFRSSTTASPSRSSPGERRVRRGDAQARVGGRVRAHRGRGQRPGAARSTRRCARRSSRAVPADRGDRGSSDYKVRILDGATGTAAITRVLDRQRADGERRWSTRRRLAQHRSRPRGWRSPTASNTDCMLARDAAAHGVREGSSVMQSARSCSCPATASAPRWCAEARVVLETVGRAGRARARVRRAPHRRRRHRRHRRGRCPTRRSQACQRADAVLLGAVGGPKWDDPTAKVRPEQGLLGLRRALGLYANLRPVRAHPALADASPLKPERLDGRRPPVRARADRRPLLRPAAAAREVGGGERARSTRSSTPTRRSAASCGSRSASRGASASTRHLGRQGQRARVVAALARRSRSRSRPSSRR